MKSNNYIIIFSILVMFLVPGCNQKHTEGEPDVISSIRTNLDERLIVVANRDLIENREEFAKLILQKYRIILSQLLNFLRNTVMLLV